MLRAMDESLRRVEREEGLAPLQARLRAGEVSRERFLLALRLGDPRCVELATEEDRDEAYARGGRVLPELETRLEAAAWGWEACARAALAVSEALRLRGEHDALAERIQRGAEREFSSEPVAPSDFYEDEFFEELEEEGIDSEGVSEVALAAVHGRQAVRAAWAAREETPERFKEALALIDRRFEPYMAPPELALAVQPVHALYRASGCLFGALFDAGAEDLEAPIRSAIRSELVPWLLGEGDPIRDRLA